MPFKDPEKRKKYRREWYLKNKNSEIKHVKKGKAEIRKWFQDYKKSLKCIKCGESHTSTIDFHHVRGKEENISKLVTYGNSIERIKKGLEKCMILCSNCHRKEHWKNNKF